MVSVRMTLLSFMFSVLSGTLTGGQSPLLEPGQIGYRLHSWQPGFLWMEATDGRAVLTAALSRDEGLITCQVNTSQGAVEAILRSPGVTFETIGEEEIRETWRRCLQAGITSDGPARRAAATTEMPFTPFPPKLHTAHPDGPNSHVAIAPGTKWCGKGNVASSYDDLGRNAETDKCCRTHDSCPYNIPAITHKYNYDNLKPWTVSWCPCDMDLYNCLKNVNTTASNNVGMMFFGMLGMQCFNFGIGQYCAELHWSHLACNLWETGPMAVISDFPKSWEENPDGPIGR